MATAVEDLTQGRRMQGIEKAIDRLYRLSLIIRQPSRSSQNERAQRFTLTDDAGNEIDESFAVYARRIVDHKFVSAPTFLRTKLSNDIVIRRKRFSYRQAHQRKLSGVIGPRNNPRDKCNDTDGDDAKESTVRAFNTKDGEALRMNMSPESFGLNIPATSQTSASAIPNRPLPLATAMEDTQSNQSTMFTATPTMSAPVEIPRPPKPAAGSKEFECPYCCLVLPIKQSKAVRWRYVFDSTSQILSSRTCSSILPIISRSVAYMGLAEFL